MKRTFGTLWFVVAFGLAALSVHTALGASGTMRLAWLGVLLAALSVPGWLLIVVARRRARTRAVPPVALVFAGLGVLLSAAAVPAVQPLAYALAVVASHVLYLFWYSRIDTGSARRLRVGDEMPEFEAEDIDGNIVRGADFRGSPAVFMFFRGNWCPLCMAQIREIAAQYRELHAMGVEVVLISPQSSAHTRALAKRFDAPMRFLVDRDHRAATALGILHQGGVPLGFELMGYDADTVLPTVVVSDAAGVVRFAEQADNYRVRPEPETFLAVLRGADA